MPLRATAARSQAIASRRRSEIRPEKFRHSWIDLQLVLELGDLVPLVFETNELDRPPEVAQLFDHLLGLANRHARIVRPVDHQQRRPDLVDVIDWRYINEKVAVLF